MGRPAAVDGQGGAGDRCGGITGQERGESPDLLDGGETLVGLLRQEHVPDHLLARDAMRFGLVVDLGLDQRGRDIARADGVAGDVLLRRAVLQGSVGERTRPTPRLCLSGADGLQACKLKHAVRA